ncbi:hypothetical protein H5119_13770 [Pseudoalteromonas sp. SG45-5]|uniref:hypothetical protein n=1 Tax=unclassified Pseudoalteromonas TaxID=194690 RepID=UPI0015F9703B|nr:MULTISPECIES: hypothetical protein [unclassified Pseudoalteromonas]MBB1386594.1 hypothetical protein [Pseudoalteromonas sp. SG45-5]MBB1394632.1 hypothetical protein [Pseudoalteromonas sp. SG44-4]MBB1449163.1 hypothetical protein [Pseudoalteromonas sp. SG41-6]
MSDNKNTNGKNTGNQQPNRGKQQDNSIQKPVPPGNKSDGLESFSITQHFSTPPRPGGNKPTK